MNHLRSHVLEILGTAVSGGSALKAWQEQAQWGVSVTAGLVAIVAGGLTIWSIFRGKTPPPEI